MKIQLLIISLFIQLIGINGIIVAPDFEMHETPHERSLEEKQAQEKRDLKEKHEQEKKHTNETLDKLHVKSGNKDITAANQKLKDITDIKLTQPKDGKDLREQKKNIKDSVATKHDQEKTDLAAKHDAEKKEAQTSQDDLANAFEDVVVTDPQSNKDQNSSHNTELDKHKEQTLKEISDLINNPDAITQLQDDLQNASTSEEVNKTTQDFIEKYKNDMINSLKSISKLATDQEPIRKLEDTLKDSTDLKEITDALDATRSEIREARTEERLKKQKEEREKRENDQKVKDVQNKLDSAFDENANNPEQQKADLESAQTSIKELKDSGTATKEQAVDIAKAVDEAIDKADLNQKQRDELKSKQQELNEKIKTVETSDYGIGDAIFDALSIIGDILLALLELLA